MKTLSLKIICLVLAFATVVSTACGCQPVDDNAAVPNSSTVASENNSSEAHDPDASSEAPASSVASEPAEPFDPERTYGNTASNLNNCGLASIQGKWIYYGTGKGLFKIKTDQSKTVWLCEGVHATYINVSGAWVYFIDSNTRFIFRVRTDGTGFEKFSDQKAYFLSVVNGWAFYTVDSISSPIYKTPLDKFEPTEVIKERVSNRCIYENKIYYSYDLKIYSTDFNGRNKVCYDKVSGAQGMFFHNGYKYGTGNLTKEKLDGSFSQTLVPNSAFNVTIENGWIYYTLNRTMSSHNLYKMRLDGTDNQLVRDVYCSDLSVVGDWIYFNKGVKYIEFSSNSSQVTLKPHRMKIDGTQLQELM